MSVKLIFKTLIGTIVLMVLTSLVIEMLNISTSALQLNQMAKISCRQSAVLFSQETYKQRDAGSVAGGSVNMDAVKAADGGTYVSGNFYGEGVTPEQIYTKLYTSSAFKTWLSGEAATKGHWKSLDLIDKALNSPSSLVTTFPSNINSPSYDSQVEKYTESMLALSYKNVMMTPLNMGVPYLDKEVLNKIFQWNLAQMASDCKSEGIMRDDKNNYYVSYNGFRVYADKAKITNLDYKVYDITNMSDMQEFRKVTHIDPDQLGYDDSLINYLGGYAGDDERKRICVVGIEFSVPVAYEGITPIKSIFNFIWNNEVEGLDGNQGQDNHFQWNDATADLVSGGFGQDRTPPGVLPVPGKLIYYVVR